MQIGGIHRFLSRFFSAPRAKGVSHEQVVALPATRPTIAFVCFRLQPSCKGRLFYVTFEIQRPEIRCAQQFHQVKNEILPVLHICHPELDSQLGKLPPMPNFSL